MQNPILTFLPDVQKQTILACYQFQFTSGTSSSIETVSTGSRRIGTANCSAMDEAGTDIVDGIVHMAITGKMTHCMSNKLSTLVNLK